MLSTLSEAMRETAVTSLRDMVSIYIEGKFNHHIDTYMYTHLRIMEKANHVLDTRDNHIITITHNIIHNGFVT